MAQYPGESEKNGGDVRAGQAFLSRCHVRGVGSGKPVLWRSARHLASAWRLVPFIDRGNDRSLLIVAAYGARSPRLCLGGCLAEAEAGCGEDRKSTRLNSSHVKISYA